MTNPQARPLALFDRAVDLLNAVVSDPRVKLPAELCDAILEFQPIYDRAPTSSAGRPAPSSAEVRRLRKALKPFAAISLARDEFPEVADTIDGPDLAFTAKDVRRARAALSPQEPT